MQSVLASTLLSVSERKRILGSPLTHCSDSKTTTTSSCEARGIDWCNDWRIRTTASR